MQCQHVSGDAWVNAVWLRQEELGAQDPSANETKVTIFYFKFLISEPFVQTNLREKYLICHALRSSE